MTSFNVDGLLSSLATANPLGIGSGLSPSATAGQEFSLAFGASRVADYLYISDGIARRIIELPVDTALSKGFEMDDVLQEEFKRLDVKRVMKRAGAMDRLYGGCIVVAYADDGIETLEKPLGAINRVHSFEVFERFELTINSQDYTTDVTSPNYGQPEYYTITRSRYGGSHLSQKRVHYTRVHRMDGVPVSYEYRRNNDGWGGSALTSVSKCLADYNYMMGALPSLVKDFITTTIQLDQLAETLAIEGGEATVMKRINVINQGRQITNSVVLSGGDSYSKQASSTSGLEQLLDRSMFNVSANTGIPATLLFGRAPQGMSATGEGDANNWHQTVEAYQEDVLTPLADWIIGLIEQQTEWDGDKPESFTWAFPDLAPMDESKRADIKLKNAQADAIYANLGAIEPAWLYEQRHQEVYKFDIEYSPEAYDEWLAEYGGGVNSGISEPNPIEEVPPPADAVPPTA